MPALDAEAKLRTVLAELIAQGRASLAPEPAPPWLRELGPRAHPELLLLYRTLAPGPIGGAGARLLQPERLDRLRPDWALALKQDFLAVLETPHGGLVCFWMVEGGWRLVELFPGSIAPRDLRPLGLAGWLRDELEGQGRETVALHPLWGRLTLIMWLLGVLGLLLTALLLWLLAREAERSRLTQVPADTVSPEPRRAIAGLGQGLAKPGSAATLPPLRNGCPARSRAVSSVG